MKERGENLGASGGRERGGGDSRGAGCWLVGRRVAGGVGAETNDRSAGRQVSLIDARPPDSNSGRGTRFTRVMLRKDAETGTVRISWK